LASQNLGSEGAVKLRDCIQTLSKVVNNIIANPLEPKFKRLPTANVTIQNKVLSQIQAIAFLKTIGFTEG
jgi:hypothetical protein